jgi:hypothetical protein
MKANRFLLVLLLVGTLFVLLCGFFLYPLFLQKIQQPFSFGSGISYRFRLETDTPLYNATFLVPLPVRNGIAAVGFLNLSEGMFNQPGYNASFVLYEGDQYLKLTAESIPAYQPYQVNYGDKSNRIDYSNQGYRVEYKSPFDYPYWINTRQPLGNETVFFPKANLTVEVPVPPTYMTGSGIRLNPVVTRYQTKIYAEFDSQNATSVHIIARIDGYNIWVEEFDASRGNSYSDSFMKYFTQSAHGWYLAEGEMQSGEGKYLDGIY